MPKSRRPLPIRIAPILSPLLALTSLLAACGGSTSSSTAPPTAGETAYCNALKTYVTACPGPSVNVPCQNAVLAQITTDCVSIAAFASAAYQTALTTCAPDPSCPGGDAIPAACFDKVFQAIPLTAAQTKLATDYCNTCGASSGVSTAECIAGFYGTNPDAGGPEAGSSLSSDSDAVIERIDSTCVSGGADGGAACGNFVSCASAITESLTPPNPAACTAPVDGR